MGKKSRRRVKTVKEQMPFVTRTFEGLPGECDWVAMREMVPAATAALKIAGTDKSVRVCSLLPGANAGLVRPNGEVWIGLQVQHNFGDISRDLAHALEIGLEAEPGQPIAMTDPGIGKRLQDLVAPDAAFKVEVHDGFDYWIADVDTTDSAQAMLDMANESATPAVRLSGVEAAYWMHIGPSRASGQAPSRGSGRRFLRWVMPHDESTLLNALARLHQGGESALGEGIRLIGSFRAHGLLVPVWELPGTLEADSLEQPAVEFAIRLDEALADTSALTSEQRSARNGLANRQLTIR